MLDVTRVSLKGLNSKERNNNRNKKPDNNTTEPHYHTEAKLAAYKYRKSMYTYI